MLKDLLESLGITKEKRIAIYASCVTAVAMYFISDNFLFNERSVILAQNKSEIDALKLSSQKLEAKSADYQMTIEKANRTIGELTQEISRLRSYEEAFQEWKKALDRERVQFGILQEQFNQVNQGSKEIRQTADNCIAERSDLKANITKLNDMISSYVPLVDRKNEAIEIEKNKNLVEARLAELEGDSFGRQYNAPKIEQLKRVSAEYQQQLLQLRKCSR